MKFAELGLNKALLKAIDDSGYEEATPIQAETIPLVMQGLDVIGQAQTGTGKTAAFGLPILDKIDMDNPNVQALIVSPTRELAIQTQEELYRLGKHEHARVQVVYGGADIRRQINSLKNHPQIIVGTPGRLLDHINRKTVRLDHVQTLVLDEADEMLDMGFVDDIESIIKQVPETRQTLLFSATMPDKIKRIGVQFMHEPHEVRIKAKELTTDLVDQFYVKSKEYEKFDLMTHLFDVQAPDLTIVFGRTKRRVDELSKGLEARGYNAAGIHGDLTQQRRSQILKQFREGQLDILVATDVAARGLDISGVTHVYNYDIPQDPESYVHRIGRTGRAGHHGTSLTFVTPNEMDYLREIEKLTKVRMLPLKPPSVEEAFAGQLSAAENKVAELVKETDTSKFDKEATELLDRYDAEELVAALLSNLTPGDEHAVPVHITPERPLPNRHGGGHGRGGNGRGHSNGHGGYRGNNSRNGRNSRFSRERENGNRGHFDHKTGSRNSSSAHGSSNGNGGHSNGGGAKHGYSINHK